MSFSRISASLVAICLSVSAALADDAAQQFTSDVASGNKFEIDASQLALNQSADPEVLAFAKMMVEDHTKAGKDLVAAAHHDGITVPADMNAADAAQLEALKADGGKAFDDAYLASQVAGHKNTLALLTSYAQNGTSPALKAFAANTAPVVQMHLAQVEQIAR